MGETDSDKIRTRTLNKTIITAKSNTLDRNKTKIYNQKTKKESVPVAFTKTIKDNVKNHDDRTDSVAMAVTTGEIAVKTFRTSQDMTPHVKKAVISCSKKGYRIGEKTINVVKNMDSSLAKLQTGQIQLNHDTYMRIKAIAYQKIRNTTPSQRLNSAIDKIKSNVNNVAKTSRYITTKTLYCYQNARYGAIRIAKVTRGLLNGTVRLKVDKNTLASIRNANFKGLKKRSIAIGRNLKTGVKTGIKTGIKTTWNGGKLIASKSFVSTRKGYRGLKKGFRTNIVKVGDFLYQQDDTGTQALGMGIKTARYTVKVTKATPKVMDKTIKTAVKVSTKTTKGILNTHKVAGSFLRSIRTVGMKSTLIIHRDKIYKSIRKAGGSIVNVMMNSTKKIIMKAIMPLIIIILLIFVVVNTIVTCGAGAYQILFGWTCSNKDTGEDIDEQEWLTKKITDSRKDLVDDVKKLRNDNLKSGGGQYDYVRLFNAINDTEIDLTDTNIISSVYSLNEYYEYIQPIFHVMLFSKYELEATESEMNDLYDEIWDKLTFITTTELPIEYCNGGVAESDGNIHADIVSCPNHSEIKYHTDDTDTSNCSCDYIFYECLGHKGTLNCGKSEHTHSSSCYSETTTLTCTKKHTHKKSCYTSSSSLTCTLEEHTHSSWKNKDDTGCYSTDYCSNKDNMPSGCSNSKKHKGCNGYYICNGHKILAINISVGNFEDLLNSYFLDRIKELEDKGSLSEDEASELDSLKENYEICISYIESLDEELGLGDGTVVDLEGVTLNKITEYACEYIGNPYVFGGNDINNGIDHASFVKYVYSHFGISLPRDIKEQILCGTEIAGLSLAKEGDLIFYSEDGTDKGVYHVAIYLGNGKMIHASNSKPYPSGGIKISYVYGKPYKIKRVAN